MNSHVRPTPVTDRLYDYVLTNGLRESAALRRLREETSALPDGEWQTAPEQGPLLDLLVKLLSARRVLEVGTFTGYGALCLAQALPEDGCVVTCDVSETFTAIGRRHWAEAGVDHKIDLRLGPAATTLDAFLADGQGGSFDLAFIDADKENYLRYYEQCHDLVRPGGIIAVDNTLWDGRPADPENTEPSTLAIRALNARIHADERVDLCFLPFADGLTLARKR